MISHTVRDKYNSRKIWIITKTPCRHYNLEQRIEYTNRKGNMIALRSGFSCRRGLKDIQDVLKFVDLEWMTEWKPTDELRWHTAWEEFINAELDLGRDFWQSRTALKRMKAAKKRCLDLCEPGADRDQYDRLLEVKKN